MTAPQIDYAAVFRDLPIPVLLLTPQYVIADLNLAYQQVTGRTREELLGRHLFEAFPDNPEDPDASGVRGIAASLERVLANGKPDTLSLQQYDVEMLDNPGQFARRFWCPVNAPVFGPDGQLMLLVQCVEEITTRVQNFIEGLEHSVTHDRNESQR
jgi:PAS domain-containing protein